jgi:hypothetical protein
MTHFFFFSGLINILVIKIGHILFFPNVPHIIVIPLDYLQVVQHFQISYERTKHGVLLTNRR